MAEPRRDDQTGRDRDQKPISPAQPRRAPDQRKDRENQQGERRAPGQDDPERVQDP